MATTELTPPVTLSEPRTGTSVATRSVAPVARASFLTFEHLAYLTIALLSVITHLWALGERALHHDETLHAAYAWYIYVGRGYTHDPLLHGPFLYYFGSLMYFLFGDNDFTARLGAALFGSVLTLLPFLIRREIGRPAALLASLYLLISPTFLYVGRFIRHDIYSITFEMLVFVAILRYATTRQAGWLYLGAAAFALMYSNQETSYLFLLIMATPLILLLLWRTFKPGIPIVGLLGVSLAALVFVLPGHAKVDDSHNAIRDTNTGLMEYTPGPLFGWYPLETEDNTYALNIRNHPDNLDGGGLLHNLGNYLAKLWLFFKHPAILIGIGLVLASMALITWCIWLWRDGQGRTAWQRAIAQGDTALPVYASLMNDHRWLAALGIFFLIYAMLFTAFLTNLIGVISGTTGSLLYWLAQHNVERGGQPGYYYLVILSIYEPLALLGALIGMSIVGYRVIKGLVKPSHSADASPDNDTLSGDQSPGYGMGSLLVPLLLVWWVIAALGIYSWAGEKMPWLTVHVALPIVLLAAWGCQRFFTWSFDGWNLTESRHPFALFGGFFALVIGLAYVNMTTYVGSDGTRGTAPLYILLMVLMVMAILVLAASLTWGWRWSLGALVVCIALTGMLYTVRNAYRVTYALGDIPREMLIYTQTSPDVPRVVRKIEEISRLRTSGLDMPIMYDNETVWLWYLRNFTRATNSGTLLSGPPASDVMAVFLLQENIDQHAENLDYLKDFRIQRMPLRWWFPEDQMYRKRENWQTTPLENASLLTRVMRAPFDNTTLTQLWKFLMYRDLRTPLGSTDFVLAVRPEIADQISLGFGAPSDR